MSRVLIKSIRAFCGTFSDMRYQEEVESIVGTPLLDVVRVVCMQGDKVLLVKEVDDPNWKLPGGKIHESERIIDALMREVDEELGIAVDTSMVKNYIKANIPDSENYRHIIMLDLGGYEPKKTSEVAEWGWYAPDNLPQTKYAGHISSAVSFVTTK